MRKKGSLYRRLLTSVRKRFSFRIISIDGIRIFVSDQYPQELVKLLYAERYELEERELVKRKICSDDRVLEIGTGLGLVALTCARICGSEAVLCYEANPYLKDQIERNFKLNNSYPVLRNKAVSTERGEFDFYVCDNILSSSFYDRKLGKAQPIECDSIDEVIREFLPTALVMDVEGAEIELLPQADLDCLQKIVVELHPKIVGQEPISNLISYLKKEGFKYYAQESRGNVHYFSRV